MQPSGNGAEADPVRIILPFINLHSHFSHWIFKFVIFVINYFLCFLSKLCQNYNFLIKMYLLNLIISDIYIKWYVIIIF